MLSVDLALDIREVERNYPENPLDYFRDKNLCLFKACLSKFFPGVRWGIQDLLEELELNAPLCINQSCCSGTFFQRNLITRAQFAAINERNLSEMNQIADIVLFSCNGCYNSVLRGREFLKIPESSARKPPSTIPLNSDLYFSSTLYLPLISSSDNPLLPEFLTISKIVAETDLSTS